MKKLFMFGVLFLAVLTLAACKKDPTISFADAELDLAVGEEVDLAPVLSETGLEVVYSVAPEGVVEITGATVKALADGEATVTATIKDTEITATVKIYVGRNYDITKPYAYETELKEGFTALSNENENPAVDEEGYYQVGTEKFKVANTFKTTYTTEPVDALFNYLINTWTYNSYHYTNMVDGLVENDKYSNIIGAIALGYKTTENADNTQTWTFQLREKIQWVDNATGEVYAEVVADDFVAALEYVLDPINGSGTAGIVMGVILNAKEYYEGEEGVTFEDVGVKAISDYEVEYTLIQPTPYFLSSLTYSPFLPVNRDFIEERGTDFGATVDDILVNGAFRITEHVKENRMIYTKNELYWDAKHVYVDRVERKFVPGTAVYSTTREWFEAGLIDSFTVNVNDEVGYAKYVTGGEEGTGTLAKPAHAQANGVLSVGDATYIGYYNFARTAYEYTNSEYVKTEAEKAATTDAVLNVNFRKGVLYGLDVMKYLVRYNPDEPEQWLMRGYTNRELCAYDGLDYADYVDAVFNEKQGTTGVSLTGITYGEDPVYDEDKSKAFFATAKTELLAAGLTEADFPIKIDAIGSMNPVTRAFEEAMYDTVTAASDGVMEVRLNVPGTNDQNVLWGSVISNYDFSLWSGWGPDYADPNTFLHTMAMGGDMIDMLGFDGSNKDLEEEVLGEYDALYRAAAAIVAGDKIGERYEAFAEAEYALIYEYAIIVPWLTQSGYSAVVAKTVPFQAGRASYGLTSDKFKNVVVSSTIITQEQRAVVVAEYEANR